MGPLPLLYNDVTNDTVNNTFIDIQDSNAERIGAVIDSE
jgi:hypothetical protein